MSSSRPVRPEHPGPSAPPTFHERLVPGPAAWAGAVGLGAIVAVALWPLAHRAGIAIGAAVAVATIAGLVVTAPVVEVAAGTLRAGRARVPLEVLGDVTALSAPEQMRTALGTGLDARAYVCLRAWARTGLRVELTDPHDPTPYWLVSTRRPDELAAVLRAAAGAGDDEGRHVG